MDTTKEAIGERVREVRKGLKLRQVDLGKKIGGGKQSISNYENGVSFPPYDFLAKLSLLAGVSLDWLVTGQEFPAKEGAAQDTAAECGHVPLAVVEIARERPHLMRLLEKAAKVLQSATPHAGALLANVEAFYEAVGDRQQLKRVDQEIAELKEQVRRLAEKDNNILL